MVELLFIVNLDSKWQELNRKLQERFEDLKSATF